MKNYEVWLNNGYCFSGTYEECEQWIEDNGGDDEGEFGIYEEE